MSEEEGLSVDSADTQLLTAQYKDGQLQIIQVTPFDSNKNAEGDSILPDTISDGDQQKYMQVLDPNKGLVQLDLLNLTLVRCDDGEESYRLVTNTEADGGDITSDATVACVLQSSDGEDQDNQDYVVVHDGEGDQGSLVFLQSSSSASQPKPSPPSVKKQEKQISSAEILEKIKVTQKAKSLLGTQTVRPGKRGRRRTGELPPPHELLASPNLKLFLYSCKLCHFKCNAIKELQAHRAAEHAPGRKQPRSVGGARGGSVNLLSLQCARCPFRGSSNSQLLKHLQMKHDEEPETTTTPTMSTKIILDSKEVEEADVLVCGACGFESAVKDVFIKHIEDEHGATTC